MLYNNCIILLVFVITLLSLLLHLVLIPSYNSLQYDYYIHIHNNINDNDILKDEIEWLSNDQRKRFEDIRSNQLTSSDIEIIIARYEEDISWCNIYKNIVTVYDKSKVPLPLYRSSIYNKYITLDNIGRESNTYLYHIVHNYHNLASITVFSQGSKPTKGYKGHRQGTSSSTTTTTLLLLLLLLLSLLLLLLLSKVEVIYFKMSAFMTTSCILKVLLL